MALLLAIHVDWVAFVPDRQASDQIRRAVHLISILVLLGLKRIAERNIAVIGYPECI